MYIIYSPTLSPLSATGDDSILYFHTQSYTILYCGCTCVRVYDMIYINDVGSFEIEIDELDHSVYICSNVQPHFTVLIMI